MALSCLRFLGTLTSSRPCLDLHSEAPNSQPHQLHPPSSRVSSLKCLSRPGKKLMRIYAIVPGWQLNCKRAAWALVQGLLKIYFHIKGTTEGFRLHVLGHRQTISLPRVGNWVCRMQRYVVIYGLNCRQASLCGLWSWVRNSISGPRACRDASSDGYQALQMLQDFGYGIYKGFRVQGL